MNLDAVIEAGKGLSDVITPNVGAIGVLHLLSLLVAFFSIAALITFYITDFEISKISLILVVTSLIVLSFADRGITKVKQEAGEANNTRETLLVQWKETQAYPYIKQLELENQPIQHITLEKELTKPGQLKLTIVYTDKYNNNKVTTETDVYEVNMTLHENAEPYMVYYKLQDDLGNGIIEGEYSKVIFLPKNYKFAN